jgi:putative flippase GtrA
VTVGTISTIAFLGLFLLLREPLGALAANVVALIVTAIGNTAANRRFTFGARGASGRRRQWARALAVHGAGLALTTGALLLAQVIDGGTLSTQLCLLAVASVVATALRFVLMPAWAFRREAAR